MHDIGHAGLNNLLAAYEDKSAKAVCTFGYSPGPGHEPILFQGITDGKIVPARGPSNFGMFYLKSKPRFWFCLGTSLTKVIQGWDPIFEYEGKT